jgi:hypothetical protein
VTDVATIQDALTAAAHATWTKPLPKTLKGKVAFLVRTLGKKHGTRLAADLLGVTPRTIQRYLKGTRRHPPAAILTRIDDAVLARWQPRVRHRAAHQAATLTGATIALRGEFGYTSPGGTSSDDRRMRRVTQRLPAEWTARLLDAQARQASEGELNEIIAAALQEVYFRDHGRRAAGLSVTLRSLQYVELSY